MQDHSTIIQSNTLTLTQKEIPIRKNLAFVADINTRMKDDMSAARRKLTNSLTSNQFREVNIRTATRNFRPVVSQVQQFGMRQIRHERSQPQLMNQTLIHFTHQNPPGYNPQVPEQAESILSKQSQQVIQFRRESQVVRQNGTQMQSQSESEALMKANFTISQLQEIIKTNDQKARAAILTIQQEKEKLRIRNEQLIFSMEQQSKIKEDSNKSKITGQSCGRCLELEEKLKQLLIQVEKLRSIYDVQAAKWKKVFGQQKANQAKLESEIQILNKQMKQDQKTIDRLMIEKQEMVQKLVENKKQETGQTEQFYQIKNKSDSLIMENKRIKEENQQLRIQIQQIRLKMNLFIKQKDEALKGWRDIQNQGKIIKEKYSLLRDENQEQKNKNKKLSSEIQLLNRQINYGQSTIDQMVLEKQEMLKKLLSSRNQDIGLNKEQEELQWSYEMLVQKNKRSKIQNDDLRKEIQYSQQNIDKLLRQKQKIYAELLEIRSINEEYYSIKSKYQSIVIKNTRLQEQIITIQRDFEGERMRTRQIIAQQSRGESVLLHQKNQQLEGEIRQWKQQINYSQQTIDQLLNQKEQLIKQLLKEKSKNEILNKQQSPQKQTYQVILNENRKLQQQYQILTIKNKQITNQINFINRKLYEILLEFSGDEQQGDIGELLHSLQIKLTQYKLKIEERSAEAIQLLSKVQQKDQSFKKLSNQYSELNQKFQRNSQILENQRAKIEELLGQLRKKEGYKYYQQDQLSIANDNYIRLIQELNIKIQNFSFLLHEKESLIQEGKNNLKEAEKYIEITLQTTIQQQKKTINDLTYENNALKQNLKQKQLLESQIDSYKAQISQFSHVTNEATALSQRNDHLQEILNKMEIQNEQLIISRNMLELQLSQAEHHIHNLTPTAANPQPTFYAEQLENKIREIEQHHELIERQNVEKYTQEINQLAQGYQYRVRKLQQEMSIHLEQQLKTRQNLFKIQFNNRLQEKEYKIEALQTQLASVKFQPRKSAPNQKYGELLIKYNTLNIQYQSLQTKAKVQNQENLKIIKEQTKSISILTQENKEIVQKMQKSIVKINLQKEQVYKKLQQAQNYILELLETIKQRQAPSEINITKHPEYIKLRSEIAILIGNSQTQRDYIQKNQVIIAELQNKIKTLENQRNNAKDNAQFIQLQSQFLKLQKNYDVTYQNLEQAENIIIELQNKTKQLEIIIQGHNSKSVENNVAYTKLQQQLKLLQGKFDQQYAHLEKAQNYIVDLLEKTKEAKPVQIDANINNNPQYLRLQGQLVSVQQLFAREREQIIRSNEEILQNKQSQLNQAEKLIIELRSEQSRIIKQSESSIQDKINQIHRAQIIEKDKQLFHLKSTLENLNSENIKWSRETQKLTNQFQSERSSLNSQITYLKSQITSSNNEINRLSSEITRLSIEPSQNLSNNLRQLRQQISLKQIRIEQLQKQNEYLSKVQNQIQVGLRKRQQQLNQASHTIQVLRSQLQLGSSRLSNKSESRDILTRVQKELHQSRKLLSGAQMNIAKLNQVIIRAQGQIKGLNSYIVELQQKSQSGSSRNQSPAKELMNVSIEDLKHQNTLLSQTNQELQNLVNQLQAQLEQRRKRSIVKEVNINEMMRENEQRLNKINILTQKLHQMENQSVSQSQVDLQHQEQMVSQIQQRDQQINDYLSKLQLIQNKLKEVQERSYFFENKLAQAQRYIFQIESSSEIPPPNKQSERIILQQENQKLKSELSNIISQLNLLKAEHQNAMAHLSNIDQQNAKLNKKLLETEEELSKERLNITQTIKTHKKELELTEQNVNSTRKESLQIINRLSKAEQQLFKSKEQAKQLINKSNIQLITFKQQTRNQQSKFDETIIILKQQLDKKSQEIIKEKDSMNSIIDNLKTNLFKTEEELKRVKELSDQTIKRIQVNRSTLQCEIIKLRQQSNLVIGNLQKQLNNSQGQLEKTKQSARQTINKLSLSLAKSEQQIARTKIQPDQIVSYLKKQISQKQQQFAKSIEQTISVIDELKKNLGQKQNELASAKNEAQQVIQYLLKAEAEVARLNTENQTITKGLNLLKDQQGKSTVQITTLRNVTNQQETTISRLNEELQNNRKEILKKIEQNSRLFDANNKLSSTINLLHSDLAKSHQEINSKMLELAKVNQINLKSNETIIQQNKQLVKTQQQSSQKQSKIKSQVDPELQQQMKRLEFESTLMRDQLLKYQLQIKQLISDKTQSEKVIDNLNQNLLKNFQEKNRINTQMSKIISINKQLTQAASVTQQSLNSSNQELLFFKGKLAEAEGYIFQLEKNMNSFKIQNIKPVIQDQPNFERKTLALQNQKLNHQLARLQFVIGQKQSIFINSEKTIKQLIQELNGKTMDLQKYKKNLVQVENKVILLQNKNAEIIAFKESTEEKLRKVIQDHHNENSQAELLIISLNTKVQDYERKLQVLKGEILQNQGKLKSISEETIIKLTAELSDAKRLANINQKQLNQHKISSEEALKKLSNEFQKEKQLTVNMELEYQRQLQQKDKDLNRLIDDLENERKIKQKYSEQKSQSELIIKQLSSELSTLKIHLSETQLKQLISERDQKILQLNSQLLELNQKSSSAEKEFIRKIDDNQSKILSLREQISIRNNLVSITQQEYQQIMDDLSFYRNKLTQAEQHIVYLENLNSQNPLNTSTKEEPARTRPKSDRQLSAPLQFQIAKLKGQIRNQSAAFTEEMKLKLKSSQQSMKLLESDKLEILNKYKESQKSIQTLKQNLLTTKQQANSIEQEITELKQEKEQLEKRLIQTKNSLQTTEHQKEFFQGKLMEAEEYIISLEQKEQQKSKLPDKPEENTTILSEEVSKLHQEIKSLNIRNIQIQTERQRILQNLSNQSEELKRVTKNLQVCENRLREFTAKVEFLQAAKKRVDDKVADYKQQVEKITNDLAFFKNKLREAEDYIGFLQQQRNKQHFISEAGSQKPSQKRDQSQDLLTTIANLQQIIKDLEIQKQTVAFELKKAEVNYAHAQQALAVTSTKLLEKQKKIIELQGIKDNQQSNTLTSREQTIKTLEMKLKQGELKLISVNSSFDLQRNQLKQLIISLTEKNKVLSNDLSLIIQQFQEMKVENSSPGKGLQGEKIQDPSDSEHFFKNKLLEAQSYIQQLQKQKYNIEVELVNAKGSLHKNEEQIVSLKKEIIKKQADNSVLENTVIQLNRSKEELVDSIRVAKSQEVTKQLVTLNEQKNRLHKQLNQNRIQALSAIQNLKKENQNITVSYQKEKSNNQEAINKICHLQNQAEQFKKQISVLTMEKNEAQKLNVALQSIKEDNKEIIQQISSYSSLKQEYEVLKRQKQNIFSKLEEKTIFIQNLENKINSLGSEVGLFKNKLLQSESYILQLQKQLRERPTKHQSDVNASILRDRIVELQTKSREAEMKIIMMGEKQKQNSQVQFFKNKLLEAQAYISDLQKKGVEDGTPSEGSKYESLVLQIERLNDEIVIGESEIKKSQKVISDLIQKNKELANQNAKLNSNCAELQQKNRTLTDLINQFSNITIQSDRVNQQIVKTTTQFTELDEQKSQLMKKLQVQSTNFAKQNGEMMQKLIQCKNNIIQLTHRNNYLQKENGYLINGKKETEIKLLQIQDQNKILKDQCRENNRLIEQIQRLKNIIIDHQQREAKDIQRLNNQLNDKQSEIKSLQQLKEKFQQSFEEAQARIKLLEQKIVDQESDEEEPKQGVEFFKNKLFDAQAFIKELEQQIQASKLGYADLSMKMVYLNEQVSKLRLQNQNQRASIPLDNSSEEVQKGQLLIQAYSQIAELKDENLRLHQKLQTIKIEVSHPDEEEQPNEIKFLKDKLYEAETYIVQLQKEIQSLTQETTDKQTTIKELESNIEALNLNVVEVESRLQQITSVNDRLKRQKEKITTVDPLREEMAAHFNDKIIELQAKLQNEKLSNKKIEQALNEKEKTQRKYHLIIDQQKDTINSHENNLKEKDQLINQIQSKLTLTSQLLENSRKELQIQSKFFKQKLLQAEGYITELQRQNSELNSSCGGLKEHADFVVQQISILREQIRHLEQKLNNSDVQKIIISKQLNSLKQEHQKLNEQHQNLKDRSNVNKLQQFQPVKPIVNEQQQFVPFEQFEQIRKKLTEKEQQLEESKSINDKLVKNTIELQESIKIQQQVIQNIQKSMLVKDQKLSELQPLMKQFQVAQTEISRLHEENTKRHLNTKELLDQINRISDQNASLSEQLAELSRQDEEAASSAKIQLIETQNNLNEIKNVLYQTQVKLKELESSLGQANNNLTNKEVIIGKLQSQHQKLKIILEDKEQIIRKNVAKISQAEEKIEELQAKEAKEAESKNLPVQPVIRQQLKEENVERNQKNLTQLQTSKIDKNQALVLSQEILNKIKADLKETQRKLTQTQEALAQAKLTLMQNQATLAQAQISNIQLKGEVATLLEQISSQAAQIEHKNNIIDVQQKAKVQILQQLDQSESDNARLTVKLGQLQNVEKQFQQFKALVSDKQAAEKELADIQQQISSPLRTEKIGSDIEYKEGSSKKLQDSLKQVNTELQNELKEETYQLTKQLEEQILNLQNLLKDKEKEIDQLRVKEEKYEVIIKELKQVKQMSDQLQTNNEHLQLALVEAESQNLKLQNQLDFLGKKQEKIKQEQQKNQTEKAKIEQLINQLRQNVLQLTKQKDQLSSQLQNKSQNINQLKNILTAKAEEYEAKHREIQNLTDKYKIQVAKIGELESKLKSKTNEPETPVKMIEGRIGDDISEPRTSAIEADEYSHIREQLQDVREQLVIAQSEIQFLKQKLEESNGQIVNLNAQLVEKEKAIKEQKEKLEELESERQKQKEESAKLKESIELEYVEVQKKISQRQLMVEDKQEKIGESIKKIIQLTNSYQDQGNEPAQILSELQSFPYLNELITSILYRLRLSSAIELQKSLKIEALKAEIEQLKATKNSNEDISKDLAQMILSKQQLTEENKRLKKEKEDLEILLKNSQITENKQPIKSGMSEEGTPKSNELESVLTRLENENRQLRMQVSQLKELGEGSQRYQQLVKECADYQIHNNQLEEQLSLITGAHQRQKSKLKEYQEQIQALIATSNNQDLSRQNFELRKKLGQQQQNSNISRDVDNSISMGTQSILKTQFLLTCLGRIDELEREVKILQSEIQRLAQRERPANIASSNELKGEDSQIIERLQELQDKLNKNNQNIHEHQERADRQIYGLLKDLMEDQQIPVSSKQRIQEYLGQLENQILREYEEHQAEIAIMREQINRKARESDRQLTERSRQELLREINNLNNAIEIYHQESMRRKRLYKRVLESILLDAELLTQKTQDQGCALIVRKIQQALEKEQEEDLEFDGEDFIITGGNGHLQLETEEKEQEQIFSDEKQNQMRSSEPLGMQTDQDKKPFLKFLLQAKDLDREDLKLLKRKVAELRGRQVEENLFVLKQKEKRLEEVLQLANREASAQQIENIMVTLANSYSRDEISQIFGSEDNDQLINKLNEALCLQESFYRGVGSSTLMQEIEVRKRKYYEAPTKLSEEVFRRLLALLSAKKDDEFYQEVDLLFRGMYQIEEGFETALKKKDEMYRSHNERMNQIFNRSSSDNSEDYLAEFQKQNSEQLQMRSQRKPRQSDGSEGQVIDSP